MAAHTMACTLSNRETFVVMCWLDEEPARLARLQSEGQRLLRKGFEAALPHLSDLIYDELRRDLPDMDGVVGALLAIPTAAAIQLILKEVFLKRQDAR